MLELLPPLNDKNLPWLDVIHPIVVPPMNIHPIISHPIKFKKIPVIVDIIIIIRCS